MRMRPCQGGEPKPQQAAGVQVGPKLTFTHEYCKYSALIMHGDVILKEGQSVYLQQHN